MLALQHPPRISLQECDVGEKRARQQQGCMVPRFVGTVDFKLSVLITDVILKPVFPA